MEEKYENIRKFIEACSEIVEGKYLNAEQHISEALSAVAASRELTELFTAVTQDFNYAEAKQNYLRPAEDKNRRGRVYLPLERPDILAFVFCLFVDLDAGVLQFNDFLLRYFYIDGSYTASYTMFADRVVRPFRDIVRDCFPMAFKGGHDRLRDEQDEAMGKIAELLLVERARIGGLALSADDRAAADLLFCGLLAAAGRKDAADLTALLAGYRYFLRAAGGETETGAEIFRLAGLL